MNIIKICGVTNSGKTVVAKIIKDALEKENINVTIKTEHEYLPEVYKEILKEIHNGDINVDCSIEEVQLCRNEV